MENELVTAELELASWLVSLTDKEYARLVVVKNAVAAGYYNEGTN